MGERRSFFPQKRDLSSLVLHFECADFAQQFPALYELMCHAKRDGRYRAGARLSIFADEGKLKASVWDPDTSSVWFITLDGFAGALEAIEAALQRGGGEWRVRKDQAARR